MTFVSSLSKADPLYVTLASSLVILMVLTLANVWFSFNTRASDLALDMVVATGTLALGRGQLVKCPPCSGVQESPYLDGPFLVLVAGVVLWLITKFYVIITDNGNRRPQEKVSRSQATRQDTSSYDDRQYGIDARNEGHDSGPSQNKGNVMTTIGKAHVTSYIIVLPTLLFLVARKAMTKCPPCDA